MSSITTKSFGVLNAKNFEKFITGIYGNTYVTFGKEVAWPNSDTPTAATDTANTFYNYWNNLIGLKKITASDINLVIPRVDWTSGTVYIEYSQDLELFARSNTSNKPYDNKFYVRNSKDQVFKCLFNNGGVTSTIMPEISIDGQLPENAFIVESDGYKWKYMYTIPAGLKEKFFTAEFMPITSEPIVTNNAVDGRLDIIKIVTAGAGFNANANSNSLNIMTVSGDGSNANITVKVTTTAANGGNITGYTVISGGNNYTRATLSLVDAQKIQGTANANLIAVIGPPGGHGSSVEQELGASDIMISIGFVGDEGGVLPVSSGEIGGFRQLGVLNDPLNANSSYANASVYAATTKYNLTQPNKDFVETETVYVGSSLATATFTAVVQHYDPATYYLYVNNIVGTFTTPASLIGNTSGATASIILVTEPSVKRYSGDLLYIQNSAKTTRSPTETQQLKLTLRF